MRSHNANPIRSRSVVPVRSHDPFSFSAGTSHTCSVQSCGAAVSRLRRHCRPHAELATAVQADACERQKSRPYLHAP